MTEDHTDFDAASKGLGPDIVIRADARGLILSVSATCRILGYEPKDLVGKMGADFVHPEDRDRFIENTASVFRVGDASKSSARVHRFKQRDGSWAWLRGNPKVLPSSARQHGELLNFFEPISEDTFNKILQGQLPLKAEVQHRGDRQPNGGGLYGQDRESGGKVPA